MTKDIKHTEGPWVLSKRTKAANDYQPEITTYHACKDGKPLPKTEPNARLISAAPDLLGACLMAEKTIGDLPVGYLNGNSEIYDKIRYAIKKARGK